MNETFSVRDDGPIPVIARAASVSYHQSPDAQRKADYIAGAHGAATTPAATAAP